MRTLTPSEKRTIRYGAIALVAYLALFAGVKIWRRANAQRSQYAALQREAADLKRKLELYSDKAAIARELMEKFKMDPDRLSRATIVAEATAAIHQAAQGGGVQLASIRETAARGAAGELAAVQLEGMGPVPAILNFLHAVGGLGFPLIAGSLELGREPRGPGQLKISLTLLILDFDQWKPSETRPDA
jgi:hypothetical protein